MLPTYLLHSPQYAQFNLNTNYPKIMILSFGFGLSLKMCHEFENRCCFWAIHVLGAPIKQIKMISKKNDIFGLLICRHIYWSVSDFHPSSEGVEKLQLHLDYRLALQLLTESLLLCVLFLFWPKFAKRRCQINDAIHFS